MMTNSAPSTIPLHLAKNSTAANIMTDEYSTDFTYEFLQGVDGTTQKRPKKVVIKESRLAAMTNMERQYWEIKSNYFDVVIFFKKGKFYELYDCDAVIASREFGLKMTHDSTNRGKMRMSGVPEQSFSQWARLFVFRGFKVGRVEQMAPADDEVKAKTVERQLVQILTPATVTDPAMLHDSQSNFAMAMSFGATGYCATAFDASRRELLTANCDTPSELLLMLKQLQPKEVIVHSPSGTGGLLETKAFDVVDYASREWGAVVERGPAFGSSCSSSLQLLRWYFSYLKCESSLEGVTAKTYTFHASHSTTPVPVIFPVRDLVMDAATLDNLEILRNLYDGGSHSSLLDLLCNASTPGGKRLFRRWIIRPIGDVAALQLRQSCVFDLLVPSAALRGILEGYILGKGTRKRPRDDTASSSVDLSAFDFERALGRLGEMSQGIGRISFVDPLVHYNANLELILSAVDHLKALVELGDAILSHSEAGTTLANVASSMKLASGGITALLSEFDYEAAVATRRIIPAKGKNTAYDEVSANLSLAERALESALAKYQAFYKSDKVVFCSIGKDVFLVDVPLACLKSSGTPPGAGFVERSRTAKSVKFAAAEVEEQIACFKGCEAKHAEALSRILCEIAAKFGDFFVSFHRAAEALAELDCLLVLARFAIETPGCCRPELVSSDKSFVAVEDCWHPFLGSCGKSTTAVPNSVDLGISKSRNLLLTGPNMAGKSTLMRTLAISVIMAQLGGPVCAQSMRLSPFSRIFTRIGARDSVHQGESTLFVEVSEMAEILLHADSGSLCLVDELGRGTSTFDGYAIASASLDALRKKGGESPVTVFSTHYHSLAQEIEGHPENSDVQLGFMDFSTIDAGSSIPRIAFKYTLKEGICRRSFGCEVALKAGVDPIVVNTAVAQSKWLSDRIEIERSAKMIFDSVFEKK